MTVKHRRTKIVVTLGPALDSPAIMSQVFDAGANVFRANFSHGTALDHKKRITLVRSVAKEKGVEVAIFADLQGPKIRIARFKDGKILLQNGQDFVLDADLGDQAGDEHTVGIDYKKLPSDVFAHDKLLLDDGRLVFTVKSVKGSKIFCHVDVGGVLSNNKGINRLGGGLTADALTQKDMEDLKSAVSMDVDYIAVSFPRNADDIHRARHLLKAAGSSAGIIAKIERKEALDTLEEIIEASDAIMVARGDLGVEIGDGELPAAQKEIIHKTRMLNKPVITATQMMESMITNSIPTRAEVFDVANAVLDGTDAVMLSAETATGAYPVAVIEAMSRICLAAENQPRAKISRHRVDKQFEYVDEAIAMATMYTANHLDIRAILCLTESGSTPLWMSRIRSGIPIYGLSRNIKARRKMALYRGVYPVQFDAMQCDRSHVNALAVGEIKSRGFIKKGDLVIITKGDLMGVHGCTNAMKIYQVE